MTGIFNRGFTFEEQMTYDREHGINISGDQFCKFFKEHFHVEPAKTKKTPNGILSWQFEPMEAYYLEDENRLAIYISRTQKDSGSADTKLMSCNWWYQEYKRLCDVVGITKLSYIFNLDEYFRDTQPKVRAVCNKLHYETMLMSVRETPGCNYFFWGDGELAA